MEQREGKFLQCHLNIKYLINKLFILNFSGRFGGAGFGSRDYRTTSSMPPSRAGSGPPRRDYGGGSSNGNLVTPYFPGALYQRKFVLIIFFFSLVRSINCIHEVNVCLIYFNRRWILWWR